MSNVIEKSRNKSVDAIRGIAMLMVVLQHTIAVSTTDFEKSFIFQVVWTLQLPLFMMISGYVTRYSQPMSSKAKLYKFIKKRTLAYLLPFFVWTFLVRAIVLGQINFLNIKYLLWHMDNGYWFLVSIWTISMSFGLVDYVCSKLSTHVASKTVTIVAHLVGCGIIMIGLVAVGMAVGMDFCCIKLSLYYFPFYLCGYLYGQVQDDFSLNRSYSKIQNVVIALCLGIWIYMINRIDFFSGDDSSMFIVLRFASSATGCIAAIGLLSGIYKQGGVFRIAGIYSIEIYLIHYLFLNVIRLNPLPRFATVDGLGIVVLNYIITIGLVTLVIILMRQNPLLNKILFFKDSKRI